MKRTSLTLIIALATCCVYAQNTFPSSGNVGIGTTSPVTLLNVIVPDAKTTTVGNVAAFLSTNDASNAFGLRTMIYGASSIASRYVTLQTTDYSLVDGGSLILQPAVGNVGIGTTSPAAMLDIRGAAYWGPGSSGQLSSDGNGAIELGPTSGSGNVPYIDWHYGTGSAQDYNVRLMNSGNNRFDIITASNGTVFTVNGGNIGIGTSSPDQMLAVAGIIHSKEVKVDLTDWPDYVFKPKYTLPSLPEVKTYIDKNQHLSDMPSEEEVAKNGINLGDMNKLLTKKVEELTLYLIEKDKQITDQQVQLTSQQQQIKLQEERIEKLEKIVLTKTDQ